MERRGDTTRLVDSTIQQLFIKGEIIVREHRNCNTDGMRRSEIMQLDWAPNQKHFIKVLLRRLKVEHYGQYEVTKGGGYIRIKLYRFTR